MRRIKLYIASSIDGYIARPDGNLDWLLKYPITPESNYGYDEFWDSVGSVIMGGRTYRDILNMDAVYPYKDKMSYIITQNKINAPTENVHFISDSIIEIISGLKMKEEKDLWLVGGGEIISLFLNYDLVDEMIITIVPTILGNGIPLFPNCPKESDWDLLDCKSYASGMTQMHYRLKK